jgi:twitching motility protein PilJ
MASSTDYTQAYQKAERAYMQGSYEDAAGIIDQLAADYPSDPSVLLLRGHIYCYGLHRYSEARGQYQAVLNVTSDPEFVDFAHNGLAYAEEQSATDAFDSVNVDGLVDGNATLADVSDSPAAYGDDTAGEAGFFDEDEDDLTEFNLDAADVDLDLSGDLTPDSPFNTPLDAPDDGADSPVADVDTPDPFAFSADEGAVDAAADSPFDMHDDNPFGADIDLAEMAMPDSEIAGDDPFSDFENLETAETDPEPLSPEGGDAFASAPTQMEEMLDEADEYPMGLSMEDDAMSSVGQQDDQTLFMSEPPLEGAATQDEFAEADDPTYWSDDSGSTGETYAEVSYASNGAAIADDSASGSQSNVDFLDDFDEFDDLGSIPDFELTDSSAGFTSPLAGSSGVDLSDEEVESDSFGASDFALDDTPSMQLTMRKSSAFPV